MTCSRLEARHKNPQAAHPAPGHTMPRKKTSGIPFDSKDPRYQRAWHLIKKQGKTLEEALEDIGCTPQPDQPPKPQEPPAKLKLDKGPAPVPASDPTRPDPPPVFLVLTDMDKILAGLDRINNQLGIITSLLQSMPRPNGSASTRAPGRTTIEGLAVGDRVQTATGEKGQILRVLPGLTEVEVQFIKGRRTMAAEHLTPY